MFDPISILSDLQGKKIADRGLRIHPGIFTNISKDSKLHVSHPCFLLSRGAGWPGRTHSPRVEGDPPPPTGDLVPGFTKI